MMMMKCRRRCVKTENAPSREARCLLGASLLAPHSRLLAYAVPSSGGAGQRAFGRATGATSKLLLYALAHTSQHTWRRLTAR